ARCSISSPEAFPSRLRTAAVPQWRRATCWSCTGTRPVCRRQSRRKTRGRRRPTSGGPSSTTIEEGVRSVDYHDERFEGRGPVVDVFRMRGGVAHAHVRTRCRTQRGRELDVVFFGGFRIVEGNAVDVA